MAGSSRARCCPRQACRITIQSPSADPRTIDVDDSGFFEVGDVPAGPLRFRVELGDQVLSWPSFSPDLGLLTWRPAVSRARLRSA